MKWEKAWESFPISFSTFNVGSWNSEPVMLGQARQVEECSENRCMQVMVSDNSVSIHDKVRLLNDTIFSSSGVQEVKKCLCLSITSLFITWV